MIRFLRKLSKPLKYRVLVIVKYGALIIAGGLYIWALIFLVSKDNWVAISALTTMLLAIAAFWAIQQNYSFRKRDRKRLIKERALSIVRNWINDAVWLMMLNAQYADEHSKPEFNYGRLTLEKIQLIKDKLTRELEETLTSAQLWTDLFTLLDEANMMLKEFIDKGRAEDPNLTEKYRKYYVAKFASIFPLTRQIEQGDPDFKI